MPFKQQVSDLLDDAASFKAQLEMYRERTRIEMKDWASNQTAVSKQTSESCSYKGVLVETISEQRETYYECDCVHGFYEADCSIDREHFEAI